MGTACTGVRRGWREVPANGPSCLPGASQGLSLTPALQTAFVALLGGFAALLSAIAVYVRGAAKALEARNVSLDALAASSAALQTGLEKVTKDVNGAWDRVRALEGAVGVLTRQASGSVPASSPGGT